MGNLVLTLCGKVSLRDAGGHPVPLGGKTLALLARLVLEPRPHPREELTALLWSEVPDAKARASLRHALTELRHALGDRVLADRAAVELSPPIECDAARFLERAETEPAIATQVDVPRFLAGLVVPNAPGFEEWAQETRARLLERYERALAATARDAIARQAWRDAVAAAERWLDAVPLSEPAARALIEAHHLAGDRDAALVCFARFERRLRDETGARPTRALLALADRIGSTAQPAPIPGTSVWDASPLRFEGSLRGRTAEWRRLRDAWTATRAGRSTVVVIEGEAGIGKSRLADDFGRWVVSEGGVVLRGRGYDAGGGIPFGTVVELLRSALDAPGLAGVDPQWLAEVARVLPELASRFPGIEVPATSTPADRWRLFEGVAQLLAAVMEEAPVIVAVDDLQWCDDDTCALLHHLVRRLEGSPVLWCVTQTLGELGRGDAPAAHLARALRGGPQAAVLTLQPLSEADVLELVRELANPSTPAAGRRLASRLHEVTAGSPFYVMELLKSLFEQGWLRADPVSGEWTASASELAPEAGVAAPTLHEAIAQRIGALPDELHGVLATICIGGHVVSVDVLSHVHGISRLRAATLGDALVDRHLVLDEPEGYRCAHPLIASVVRESLTSSRRREVHRALALALELVAGSGEHTARAGDIAAHAEAAGERALAFRYALIASRGSARRCAYDEALAWLDLAARTAAGADDSRRVDQATAELLDSAGWREAPPARRSVDAETARLQRSDLDLRASV